MKSFGISLIKKEYGFIHPLYAIFLMGILYILFPSINPSGDSYMFAHQIRSGKDLFLPHHLIYNAFYYLLTKLFSISHTLKFISLMNGFFAVGCLLFSNAILSKYTSSLTRTFLLLFLGSCFGFMRYATTGETYIVPLFFSLWASWCAISKKSVFLTGLIAGIACLFHQIHIFWWVGLFIFITTAYPEKRTKNFIEYALGSCIIPLVYFAVFYLTDYDSSNILEYITHDYIHNEGVEFSFKRKSLLLTPVSFIRTFYQIHGYFFPLIQKYWILSLPIILSSILGILGLIQIKRTRRRRNYNLFDSRFAHCHLLIFFLQLIFAAISDGNAEFMVMLPFALFLFVFIRYQFRQLPIYAFALSVFIWNVSFGLIPYHFLEVTPDPALARYIRNHPEEIYYIKDRQAARENLAYHCPGQTFQLYRIMKDNKELDTLLQQHNSVLSDILTSRSLSRASLTKATPAVSGYSIEPEDSIRYDLGVLIVSRIKNKQEEFIRSE
ncbi:MAG: hypothetical protein LIO93_11295 [Bacteroidales bacterium]|nr:hypothetical protein [Bacteroidales bacterium]